MHLSPSLLPPTTSSSQMNQLWYIRQGLNWITESLLTWAAELLTILLSRVSRPAPLSVPMYPGRFEAGRELCQSCEWSYQFSWVGTARDPWVFLRTWIIDLYSTMYYISCKLVKWSLLSIVIFISRILQKSFQLLKNHLKCALSHKRLFKLLGIFPINSILALDLHSFVGRFCGGWGGMERERGWRWILESRKFCF